MGSSEGGKDRLKLWMQSWWWAVSRSSLGRWYVMSQCYRDGWLSPWFSSSAISWQTQSTHLGEMASIHSLLYSCCYSMLSEALSVPLMRCISLQMGLQVTSFFKIWLFWLFTAILQSWFYILYKVNLYLSQCIMKILCTLIGFPRFLWGWKTYNNVMHIM